MADIKVDKKTWDQLSGFTQASISKRLIDSNVIKTTDTIVGADDVEPSLGPFQAFRDCGSTCDQEAAATFMACMQSPGADADRCREIASNTFFACKESCDEDEDDDD